MSEPVPETAEAFDETDVEQALNRETDDGIGGQVPDSNFVDYDAGENVTAYGREADI